MSYLRMRTTKPKDVVVAEVKQQTTSRHIYSLGERLSNDSQRVLRDAKQVAKWKYKTGRNNDGR